MVKTFELYRGKVKPGEEATVVGEFKVRIVFADNTKFKCKEAEKVSTVAKTF